MILTIFYRNIAFNYPRIPWNDELEIYFAKLSGHVHLEIHRFSECPCLETHIQKHSQGENEKGTSINKAHELR